MSFPNIPDINPYIGISFEDSINLLIASIAMEEISLSKLIDAEKEKVLYIVNNCRCTCDPLGDAVRINKSVDETIKYMIKLQMLLQFKLENVKEMLPHCCVPNCPHTTPPPTCARETCACAREFGVEGEAYGCIKNCADKCPGHSARLCARIRSCDPCSNELSYLVANGNDHLRFFAEGADIDIRARKNCDDCAVLCGEGTLEENSNKSVCSSERAGFRLTLCFCHECVCSFRMEILSGDARSIHDSGCVQVDEKESDLHIVC